MTLDLFTVALLQLQPGERYSLPYDLFETLFPSGVEDDDAKARAFKFARDNECSVDHQPHAATVDFLKQ